jgi:hypothetical protein
MNEWKPIDFIVGLLAITIAMVLVSAMVDVLINEDAMTEGGSKRVTNIVTAMLSIISMYVGAQIQKNKDKG